MQLSVRIGLHRRRTEWWDGRRHLVCKRYAGVLAIKSVTDHAIRPEGFLAVLNVFGGGSQRVRVGAATNSQTPFCSLHEAGLESARSANLAPYEKQRCSDGDDRSNKHD